MAQGFVGADVQQLRDFAVQLKSAAVEVAAIEGRLSTVVNGARWTGPDGSRFTADWGGIHRLGMRSASELLRSRGVELARQAAEQEAASSAGGASTARGAPNGHTRQNFSSLDAAFLASFVDMTMIGPDARAKWWEGLTDDERQHLVDKYPQLIGNMEGVAYTDRDSANRIVLSDQIAAAKASGDTDLLKYLKTVDKALRADAPPVQQLVALETSDPPGAAISVGNLDTAKYVSVLVPGMGSNSTDTVTGLTSSARELWNEETRLSLAYDKSQEIAVVSWMNYDAPEMITSGDLNVLGVPLARKGGEDLARFVNGYDAVVNAQPGQDSSSTYFTIDPHSYGSTTTAYALSHLDEGKVDAVASYGSAGVSGELADTYGDNVPKGKTFAIQADEKDNVAYWGRVGSLRQDPRSLDGVVNLSSEAATVGGEHLVKTTLHDMNNGKAEGVGYLENSSTSQRNIALVNLGLDEYAIPGK